MTLTAAGRRLEAWWIGPPPGASPTLVFIMYDEALITLPEVLDVAGIQEPILVGHSDGASIALIHAAGPGAGRIRSLILEAPHSFVELVTIRQHGRPARAIPSGGPPA